MLDILNTYKLRELKKIVSATNIKGYSKLTKPELIKLMMREENIDRFKSIKPKSARLPPVSEGQTKPKIKVLRELKRKFPDYKKYIEFYEKSGFTKPSKLPPPPKWLIEGREPPANFKIPKIIITEIANEVEEPKKEKPQAKPQAKPTENNSISKVIREEYPNYLKKVKQALNDGEISDNKKIQKLQFLDLIEIEKNLKDSDIIQKISGLDNLINDEETFERYNIIIKKLNLKELEKDLIKNVYKALDNSNRNIRMEAQKVLKEADENLQRKFYKANKEKYLKFQSSFADKLNVK